jgi:xanthine dehydrogenase accessory factor
MTNPHDVLAAAQRLRAAQQPFALITVLRVAPPASARPGDKAVATAEGIAHGWIGGGCAQPAVTKTVRAALADGRARMIRIAPAAEGSLRELDEVLEFGMACHSGGTLELFVDPVLPQARLVVIGDTPLAAALAGLAPRVGLPVSVVAHGGDAARFEDAAQVIVDDGDLASVPAGAFVVVATQGRRDLQGLRAALSLDARRVFFVASTRKAQVLKASLVESGADAAAVAAIVAPAGQPIGAQTPEEIALSVLAAVVAARRAGDAAVAVADVDVEAAPVAGSAVEAAPVAGSAVEAAADIGTTVARRPRAAAPVAAEAPPAPAALPGSAAVAPRSSCCGG